MASKQMRTCDMEKILHPQGITKGNDIEYLPTEEKGSMAAGGLSGREGLWVRKSGPEGRETPWIKNPREFKAARHGLAGGKKKGAGSERGRGTADREATRSGGARRKGTGAIPSGPVQGKGFCGGVSIVVETNMLAAVSTLKDAI